MLPLLPLLKIVGASYMPDTVLGWSYGMANIDTSPVLMELYSRELLDVL
jgi:hypothetical protein